MTLTKQQDNDPSRFDILPGDIIQSLVRDDLCFLIKSSPKRLAGCDPWFVDVLEVNKSTSSFTKTLFLLKNLQRIRQPKSFDSDGTPIKARKFRNYKLIRMPRQTSIKQQENEG